MACIIHGRRLYCTTSEHSFGPLLDSEAEGDQFLPWMFRLHGDPRQYDHEVLVDFLQQFRERLCLNGPQCDQPACPEHRPLDSEHNPLERKYA